MYSDTGHGPTMKTLKGSPLNCHTLTHTDIKINFYYYDTNVIYARAKFCSSLFSI